jgi:hypothetical protein
LYNREFGRNALIKFGVGLPSVHSSRSYLNTTSRSSTGSLMISNFGELSSRFFFLTCFSRCLLGVIFPWPDFVNDCYFLPISSENLLHIEPYHGRKLRRMSIQVHGYVWGRHVGNANKETIPDDALQIFIVAQSIALACLSRNTNKKQGVDLD